MLLFDIIWTGLTEMSQLRLQTVRSWISNGGIEGRNWFNDWSWMVLLSILAINARYSVYLMTVLVQFLHKRGKEKKRRNLDAKSLLNGSWQTMDDVNLFILLRMYRVILLPRVLRALRFFIIFYWNFTLRCRSMSFVHTQISSFYFWVFKYNYIPLVYNFVSLAHHYSTFRFFKFRAHKKY